MPPDIDRLFSRAAETFQIALSPSMKSRALTFLDLLEKWRIKMNLVGFTDLESIIHKLFMESFFLAEKLKKGPGILIDIGAGAGFPGIILKIAHESKRIILIESSLKKTIFQQEVKNTLGLKGLEIERTRLEDFCRSREAFAHVLTCRGAWDPKTMPSHCAGLMRPAGLLFRFVRARDPEEDLLTERGDLIFNRAYPLPDGVSAIYCWRKKG